MESGKMVGTRREIFARPHHKSCSGGYKNNEEQEAQQAPPPGVRPADGGAGDKRQKYTDQESNPSLLRDKQGSRSLHFSAVWASGQRPVRDLRPLGGKRRKS